MYYQYDSDLKTGPIIDRDTDTDLHIDIKDDNSYVVGEGSVFKKFLNKDGTTSRLNYKPYIKDGYDTVIKMPQRIKQY